MKVNMKISFKPLALAAAIGVAAGLFSYAIASEVSAPRSATTASTTQDVSRSYLVKNSLGQLYMVRDHELDTPAVIRKMGNAKTVQYHGSQLDVETTIVKRGDRITLLDRYLPSDDNEE